jgi:hypothetical protein
MKPLTILLAILSALDVQAQGLIWTADHWAENGAVLRGSSWGIAFDHVSDPYFGAPPSQNPATRIFSMTLATNDAGRTFVANALNEPGFGGFVAGLTDGATGYLRFEFPTAWQVQSEQDFLGRSSLAPDLAGYNITQIGLRVNNFYDYFDVPEDRYFRHLDYSLDFYGAPVPEPSTWALLGLGGAAALLLRRKARKQHPAPPK